MADEIQVLNGNQFHEIFKDLENRYQEAVYQTQKHRRNPLKKDPMQGINFPGFHYTKWENIETFYHEGDWNAKARYLCYLRDGNLLGVNKFYVEPVEKHFSNDWRVKNGLAPMKGNWWGHAFVDVREDIQRQGIAVKLFDKMLSMMKPGDVFSSDMYSPQGQSFIISWVNSRRSQINVMGVVGTEYDPAKVNFTLGQDSKINSAIKVASRYWRSTLSSKS